MNDVKRIICARFDLVIFCNRVTLSIVKNVIMRNVFHISILDGPELMSSGRLSAIEIYI